MTALQQQAHEVVDTLSEQQLANFIFIFAQSTGKDETTKKMALSLFGIGSTIANVTEANKVTVDSFLTDDEAQKERDMAFARLTAWSEANKDSWGQNFDWKKEYMEALDEKYGFAD